MVDATSSSEDPLKGFWLEGDSLAPPCQSEHDIVEDIITLANPDASSELWDLGCGDGRICLAASERSGCRSFGCEIESDLIESFQEGIRNSSASHLVTAIHGDLLEIDFSTATIIVVYLLPEAIELLKPKFIDALQRGVKLICNTWGPKGLTPSRRIVCGPLSNVTLLMFDQNSIPACV
jgi:SAM-dependent methyltransferase